MKSTFPVSYCLLKFTGRKSLRKKCKTLKFRAIYFSLQNNLELQFFVITVKVIYPRK